MFKNINLNSPSIVASLLLQVVAISLLYFGDFYFMSKKLNLNGMTFGKLKVISDGVCYNHATYFECICSCGNKKVIKGTNLMVGTKSCGCLRAETMRKTMARHCKTKSPEYYSWVNMKTRCLNVKSEDYMNYGGRGIKICERWVNSFSNFITDMGERPYPKYSLDRIDSNGDYEPSNCRWASIYEQANNKRHIKYYECNGIVKNLQGWSNYFGAHQANIMQSIKVKGIERTYEYYYKKHKGDFPDLKNKLIYQKCHTEYNKRRPIMATNVQNGEVCIYGSIRGASKGMNIHHNNIRICINNKSEYRGYFFELVESV